MVRKRLPRPDFTYCFSSTNPFNNDTVVASTPRRSGGERRRRDRSDSGEEVALAAPVEVHAVEEEEEACETLV